MRVTYIDHMGSDLSVVNAARVSFNKTSDWDRRLDHYSEDNDTLVWEEEGWENTLESTSGDVWTKLSDSDSKLINYLADHKHMSPFGHCFLSVHVKAPIFVARQLVKHKFLRWNEVSRRYVDDAPEFYNPDEWRGRAGDKKQGSSDEVVLKGGLPSYLTYDAYQAYTYLLQQGVAPEQARMVLPLNTYTEWHWSGSLDAFTDMLNLRLKEDTQYETRLVAMEVASILQPLFPVSAQALLK